MKCQCSLVLNHQNWMNYSSCFFNFNFYWTLWCEYLGIQSICPSMRLALQRSRMRRLHRSLLVKWNDGTFYIILENNRYKKMEIFFTLRNVKNIQNPADFTTVLNITNVFHTEMDTSLKNYTCPAPNTVCIDHRRPKKKKFSLKIDF